ncbi:hypothetical protein GGI04_004044, partial [Coemansia thaxteri]
MPDSGRVVMVPLRENTTITFDSQLPVYSPPTRPEPVSKADRENEQPPPPHGQSHSQSYGQLPSYSKGKGTSARASHAPAGESAAYDNHPAPSESQTVYDQWPNKAGDDTDRGLADYFYKKPDPSYTGTYGTDYRPEISKTKVVTAFAAAAALLYGISRFRREKEKKKHRKYAKHADRGQYSSEYGDHEEYPHDSHS